MDIFRRVGAAVLVLAAVVVWFGMKPSDSGSPEYSTMISSALLDDEANQARAEGAPQQTVVNGWTARDLLTIIARQGSTPAATQDQRPAALLALTVIGVGLIAFTMAGAGKPQIADIDEQPKVEINKASRPENTAPTSDA